MNAETVGRAVPFVKMSGAGNDFVVIDHRIAVFAEPEKGALARRVCRRRLGVGADGLILVEPPPRGSDADYAMRYFNSDGSEGELCGNGTRCAAVFAEEIGAAGRRQAFTTPAGVIRARIVEPLLRSGGSAVVRVAMVRPGPTERLSVADLPGGPADLFALRVGVPHAIEVVPDVRSVDVAGRGSAIRRHRAFPAGANANFIAFDADRGEIHLRTFERGVEEESLACGTGATAAATVARRHFGWPPVVPVRMESGDRILMDLGADRPRMEGPVTRVYEGRLDLPPELP